MKITIPEPCQKDWGEMTPEKQGRFCSSCAKTVVDFTKMNKDDIKAYFVSKKEERTCGRFKNSQLDNETPKVVPLFDDRERKFAAALYLVFGFTLFSCTDIEEHTVGDIEPVIEHVKESTNNVVIDSAIIEDEPMLGEAMIKEEHLFTKGDVAPIHNDDSTKECSSESPRVSRVKVED